VQAAALAQGIVNLLPQLGALAVILPPETLAWKLRLLDMGNRFIADRVSAVTQRVLLLVSDGDLLLPSGAEGRRLEKLLPRCTSKVCRRRSLHEHGLGCRLRDHGNLPSQTRFS
jgi:hypothetical protein